MLFTRLRHDPIALLCTLLLLVIVLAGIFAPYLAPYDPVATAVQQKNLPFSSIHWLGTDHLGRDIYSRILFGIRTTIFYSLFAMLCTLITGACIGISAALFGGKIDNWLMRFCDVMLSFPSEVMILALIGILGPSMQNIIFAIVVSKWAWYARMLRGITLQYRERDYVRFAQVIGCNKRHIFRHHLLPNIAADTAVLASTDMSGIILMISALSFLGLGVQAPIPEWGNMLSEAKNQMLLYPLQMLPAGLSIVITLICCNVIGDFLRDYFDPSYRFNHKEVQ